ncbi:MAG: hypothetical protein P4L35_08205 [Ignavibacteriaceae bacterium]|nr:hypothetical protein [Ignavibacteriaceae bacterium]
MRNRYYFLLLFIVMILQGEFFYPQQQGNWIQNFNGIPVHTDIPWDWVSYKAGLGDTLIKAMQHMGIDFIQSNVRTSTFMDSLRDPSKLNFRLVPIASFDSNWIQYYTDAKYTAWKAGITDTNYLRHDPSVMNIVNDPGDSYLKLDTAKTRYTVNLLWGPYYFQESYYYSLEPGQTTTAPVQYNCDFQLKLELNPNDTTVENPNDTLCILKITSSRLDTPNTWTFGCIQGIDSVFVKRVDFQYLNQFQKFHFLEPYTLNIPDCPLPPHPHSGSYVRTYNINGIEDNQDRAGKIMSNSRSNGSVRKGTCYQLIA